MALMFKSSINVRRLHSAIKYITYMYIETEIENSVEH